MILKSQKREINVFTISPRTMNENKYWQDIKDTIHWTDTSGFSGILIFTGNDVFVDPWIVAHELLEKTKNLSPLIAVNPIYMHPFAVAKMISSFAFLYGRKVFVNMVTGTSLSHLNGLGDTLDHDSRYARLQEYMFLVKQLVNSVRPVSFKGSFYEVSNLQLFPRVPEALSPVWFLAGQSEAAKSVCRALDAVSIQMLPPTLADGISHNRGIHFGIVTRHDEHEAWGAAYRMFPEDRDGESMLEISMKNTDSVWKTAMKDEVESNVSSTDGYWLSPFKNFKADCPYFVGDHQRVGRLIANLIDKGVDFFILDLPASEEEYKNVGEAFVLASGFLSQGEK